MKKKKQQQQQQQQQHPKCGYREKLKALGALENRADFLGFFLSYSWILEQRSSHFKHETCGLFLHSRGPSVRDHL